ncbi:MAG: alpha/beta hydrolase [Lachnospiraceae bacterium]
MKRIFKRISIVLGTIIILLVLIILISFINHKIQLSNEDELFVPNGQMVEVNGHQMHVYVEGEGDETIVFMSGGGTCSPMLDFRSLYSLLTDQYRIVVVEKAGYGFSEVSDVSRDIDTVLYETREALSLAGVSGSFILCPHSMSGIEALYWAQTYPDEVKAIIGLDMAVPQSYENYSINMPLVYLGNFASNVGITRLIPGASESDAIKYGTLTEGEIDLYRAIFYRRTATKSMIIEVKEIKDSARKVNDNGVSNVPILLFSSNGQGTGWDETKWRGFQKSYIENAQNGMLIELDCGHYIHDIEYEKIASEIKSYLDGFNAK